MASGRDLRQSRAFKRTRRYKAAVAGIGARARAARTARGWSLERAAEAVHLDFRHLQKVETGQLNATFATLLRLADGLGIDLSALLADTNLEYGPRLVPMQVIGAGVPRRKAVRHGAARPNPVPAPTTPAVVQRTIGRAIGAYRRAAGMTQVQLAERAGVAVQYVQRVEGGKQNLTIATCVKFANALGVEPVRLLVPIDRA